MRSGSSPDPPTKRLSCAPPVVLTSRFSEPGFCSSPAQAM